METEIVVPLDGSERSEAVLPYAVALARVQQSAIVLLRVLAPPLIPSAWSAQAAAFSKAAHDEEALLSSAYLADQAQRLEAAGPVVRTELLNGAPAQCIVERASNNLHTRMIAMTTHGHGGPELWRWGSVVAKVVHAAPVPLLLVRADGAGVPKHASVVFRTILVALDGSHFAEHALQQAHELARVTEATLVLVSVLDGLPRTRSEPEHTGSATGGVAPCSAHTGHAVLIDEVSAYLQRVAGPIAAEGMVVRCELTCGKPAEAIVRVSEEQHADLVVLATHGRTGFHRLWLGSVAMKVVQGSARPVMLIRAVA